MSQNIPDNKQQAENDIHCRMMNLELSEAQSSPGSRRKNKRDVSSPRLTRDLLLLDSISPDGVVERMGQPKPFLLLDCRPFTSFNSQHITGSLNMTCCDRFSRRRLDGGKCRVSDLVCGAKSKERFRELLSSDIILYDEESAFPFKAGSSNPVMVVSKALTKEKRHHYIVSGNL